jgi:hypothetical protein
VYCCAAAAYCREKVIPEACSWFTGEALADYEVGRPLAAAVLRLFGLMHSREQVWLFALVSWQGGEWGCREGLCRWRALRGCLPRATRLSWYTWLWQDEDDDEDEDEDEEDDEEGDDDDKDDEDDEVGRLPYIP